MKDYGKRTRKRDPVAGHRNRHKRKIKQTMEGAASRQAGEDDLSGRAGDAESHWYVAAAFDSAQAWPPREIGEHRGGSGTANTIVASWRCDRA